MGRFLTAKARIEQTDYKDYWKTIDNELYEDDNGELILTPRFFWTDGYSFPNFVMAFLGGKNSIDTRPAHGHDICCRFHERIKVTMPLEELKAKNYLRTHKNKIICENIPMEYLAVEKVTKNYTDSLLKRMMISCGIPARKASIIRCGVFFNINWYLKAGKKSVSEYDIFHEDIDLVNEL